MHATGPVVLAGHCNSEGFACYACALRAPCNWASSLDRLRCPRSHHTPYSVSIDGRPHQFPVDSVPGTRPAVIPGSLVVCIIEDVLNVRRDSAARYIPFHLFTPSFPPSPSTCQLLLPPLSAAVPPTPVYRYPLAMSAFFAWTVAVILACGILRFPLVSTFAEHTSTRAQRSCRLFPSTGTLCQRACSLHGGSSHTALPCHIPPSFKHVHPTSNWPPRTHLSFTQRCKSAGFPPVRGVLTLGQGKGNLVCQMQQLFHDIRRPPPADCPPTHGPGSLSGRCGLRTKPECGRAIQVPPMHVH